MVLKNVKEAQDGFKVFKRGFDGFDLAFKVSRKLPRLLNGL